MTAKKDFTQVAHAVFMQATGQAPKPLETAKQAAGRKGGLKGGKARAESMSPAERSALAMKGVAARKKAPVTATGAASVKK